MTGGPHPYDFAQARGHANAAAERTRLAEEFFKQCARDYAEKERAYREALAKKIVELRADKVQVSIVGDRARGDKDVASLKLTRDVAEGMKDASLHALWRLAADRRDLGRFIDWSMRAAFHGEPEPRDEDFAAPIGARR